MPQSLCCSSVHSSVWSSLSPILSTLFPAALLLRHQTRKGKRDRSEFPKSNVSSFLILPRVLAGKLSYPQAIYRGDYPCRTVLLSRDMSQAALDNGSPLGWLPEGLLACPKQPLGDLVDLPASHWLIWASSLLSKPLPFFFLGSLPSFHLSIHKYLAEIQP